MGCWSWLLNEGRSYRVCNKRIVLSTFWGCKIAACSSLILSANNVHCIFFGARRKDDFVELGANEASKFSAFALNFSTSVFRRSACSAISFPWRVSGYASRCSLSLSTVVFRPLRKPTAAPYSAEAPVLSLRPLLTLTISSTHLTMFPADQRNGSLKHSRKVWSRPLCLVRHSAFVCFRKRFRWWATLWIWEFQRRSSC